MVAVRQQELGQAVVEYILLMAVVVSLFVAVTKGLQRMSVAKSLTKYMTSSFAAAYQYGHTQAKGPEDDGGPQNHPRAGVGGSGNNFRIFLNPVL